MKRVSNNLIDGFDFSTIEITPLEVAAVRAATQAGLLAVTKHAEIEAKADSVTLAQIETVILNGKAVSKDFPGHPTRQAGLNFEGRAGGIRVVRIKVAWQDYYYVATVHTVRSIRVKRGGKQ